MAAATGVFGAGLSVLAKAGGFGPRLQAGFGGSVTAVSQGLIDLRAAANKDFAVTARRPIALAIYRQAVPAMHRLAARAVSKGANSGKHVLAWRVLPGEQSFAREAEYIGNLDNLVN